MTLEKNYIAADDGKYLHRKDTDVIVSDVFLGKYDSIENWEEISLEEAEKIIESYKKIQRGRVTVSFKLILFNKRS